MPNVAHIMNVVAPIARTVNLRTPVASNTRFDHMSKVSVLKTAASAAKNTSAPMSLNVNSAWTQSSFDRRHSDAASHDLHLQRHRSTGRSNHSSILESMSNASFIALPIQRKPSSKTMSLQRRALAGRADPEPDRMHRLAAAGVAGIDQRLPHYHYIQRAFGNHDLSGVKAHIDGPATVARQAINAQAYTLGERVAFARQPTLHTAAHEAAHVIQQRHGVTLPMGLGQAGDRYEQHANRVADRVVAGHSVANLLGSTCSGRHETKSGNTSTRQDYTISNNRPGFVLRNRNGNFRLPTVQRKAPAQHQFRKPQKPPNDKSPSKDKPKRPASPAEFLICLIICACDEFPKTGKKGRQLKQFCVSKVLEMLDRALEDKSFIKAEIPYDMTKKPPKPIMSRKNPMRKTEHLPARTKDIPGFKPRQGYVRIPDAVVVNDRTKPPEQRNIKKVVEIKFPGDVLTKGQKKAHELIAGSAGKTTLLGPGPESCNCEENKRKLLEALEIVAEFVLLSVAMGLLVADDATVIGVLDDALIPVAAARIAVLIARLGRLVPRLAPLLATP